MKLLKNVITHKRFTLALVAFILIILLFALFDFYNIDEEIYFTLTGKHYYDFLFQHNLNLGVLATLFAVFVALYSAWKSIDLVHEQLNIEQQPLVVIENSIDIGGIDSGRSSQGNKYLFVRFKNIGRGPAVRITATFDRKNPDEAFFAANESHSFELGANQSSDERRIEESIVRKRVFDAEGKIKTIDKRDPVYIHIYFKDQLGNRYHRKAKFFWEGSLLKLMENKEA